MMKRKSLLVVGLGIWILLAAGCVPSKDWGGILRGRDSQEKVARDDYQKKLEEKLARVERENGADQERQAAIDQSGVGSEPPVTQLEEPPGNGVERKTPPEAAAPALAAAVAQRDDAEKVGLRQPPYPVDTQYLEERLQTYEQKMERWNSLAGSLVSLGMGGVWPEGWYDCVQQIEMVLFGYRRLLDEDDAAAGGGSGPWDLFKKDLHYVEGGCDHVLEKSNAEFRETLTAYEMLSDGQAKNLMKQLLDKGNYAASVEAYQNFIRLNGPEAVEPEMKELYSLALRRTGRLTEAAAVLKEIVAQHAAGSMVDAAALDRHIAYADLLLAIGEIEEAAKVYGELEGYLAFFEKKRDWVNGQLRLLERKESRILPDYQEVLRAALRADGRQIPVEMVTGIQKIEQGGEPAFLYSANILLHEAEDLAEERVKQQLSRVDELLHDQEFDNALALVEELLEGTPETLRSTLFRMKDEIELAAKEESEAQRQLTEQSRAVQWDKAVKSMERKDYDAAMAVFAQLLATEYDAEARRKLAEIADLDAADMRRRAAGLFVKARKTANREEKKEILFESREILMDLIERYPAVNILDKVRQNLQVLEGEIEKLDAEPSAAPGELEGAGDA